MSRHARFSSPKKSTSSSARDVLVPIEIVGQVHTRAAADPVLETARQVDLVTHTRRERRTVVPLHEVRNHDLDAVRHSAADFTGTGDRDRRVDTRRNEDRVRVVLVLATVLVALDRRAHEEAQVRADRNRTADRSIHAAEPAANALGREPVRQERERAAQLAATRARHKVDETGLRIAETRRERAKSSRSENLLQRLFVAVALRVSK
jgi:hypothetical protein